MGNCLSFLERFSRRSIEHKVMAKKDEKRNLATINFSDLNYLRITNVEELHSRNTTEHYTQLYEFNELKKQQTNNLLLRLRNPGKNIVYKPLILRRGMPFELRINFNREFKKSEDIINLVFSLNDAVKPNYSDSSQVIVTMNDENMNSMTFGDLNSPNSNAWTASLTKVEENSIVVEITSSPNALIGEYRLHIDTKYKDSRYNSYTVNNLRIFLLFNAWNKKDVVYMRNREGRNEYILNENGIIWRGTATSMRPTNWGYSQFSDEVFECVFYLLAYVGNLPISDRGNPIKIARHLTEIIHDANGFGVIKGNWTENFSNGKAPNSWLNSKEILSSFLKNKKSVHYGQCWNFAGILCTCLRTLGIASRVVTCYMAAHDTQSSLTVDRIVNENLESLKEKSLDSVWNFHTWVEMWSKRPDLDLNGKFDGWQVIDSTPQEKSDNLYRCGPTSLVAIKAGLVQHVYDTKFVYAEVNADEVFWLYSGDNEPLKLIQTNTEAIGKLLVTKSIGTNDYDDITLNYKEKEGSSKERETMLRALKASSSSFARFYLNAQFTDLIFELKVVENVLIGKPFEVKLSITNKSEQVYTVDALFAIKSSNYTNRIQNLIKKVSIEKKISPSSDDQIIVPVTFDEYSLYPTADTSFNISVLAKVKEASFDYISMIDFRLKMPDIQIETEGDIIRGQPFYCRAFFKNILPRKLTNGVFMIDGPGLDKTLNIRLHETIHVDEEASCNFALTPKSVGEKVISVKFTSNLLKDIDGFKNVKVAPNLNDITLHDEDFY